MIASDSSMLIGFVGPCASGKSTITSEMEARGYKTRHIAQEHSYVQDMWQRITNPDILIFLQASYSVTLKRRNLNWKEKDYNEQQLRLAHAREHADLYINTDDLSIEEVIQQILIFIQQKSST
jgi:cytidylate kinase